MKIRTNYISNSSSSSFLMPMDVSDITPCIKLSNEFVKLLEKNFLDWDEKKVNFSEISDEWYLTELISDSTDKYSILCDKNGIHYLEGHGEPYGYYDDENGFVVLKKYGLEFYLDAKNLIDDNNNLPEIIDLRNKVKEILNNKNFNKSQKLSMINVLFNF